MNKFFDETLNKLILLFVFDRMEIPLTENSIMQRIYKATKGIKDIIS